MAADKGYPAIDNRGNPKEIAASEYRILLAKNLKVDTNLISHRVAAAWNSNAEIYDHLASTVTAIEQGQTTNWAPKNLISGMNAASLDVRAASIELLEICRKELEKLDDIKNDKRLNAKEQEAKIAEQKQYIFGLLEDIRNANAPEKTMQWSRNFFSSIGSKLSSSFTRGNIGLAIVGVAVCVAMNIIVKVVSLAALGAFAPYALPFVIGAVALFWFAKIVKGVYNAYKEASKTANQAKSAAGDKVLEHAAKFKETDPEIPKKKQDMDDKKSAMEKAQEAVDVKEKELKTALKTASEPFQQNLRELVEEQRNLETIIREQTARKSSPKGTKAAATIKDADAKIRSAKGDLHANEIKQLQVNTILNKFEATSPIHAEVATSYPAIKAISDALGGWMKTDRTVAVGLKTILRDRTKEHAAAETVYNDAMKAVKKSRERANKEPTTPAQKTLKERLEDTTKPPAGISESPSFGSKR